MDRRIGLWMTAMAVCAGLVAAPAAQAGTYNVYACGTPAGKFTNHAWTFGTNSTQFGLASCAASDASPRMVMTSAADRAFSAGEYAQLIFRTPPGATIADFRIDRYMQQFNPVDNYPGREFLFDVGQLGPTVFELTGNHSTSSTPGAAWRGGGQAYEEQLVVTPASFGSLAGYQGDATYVAYTMGCQPAAGCALGTNGAGGKGSINLVILSATVTVNDPTKPSIGRILPTGLAAGGIVTGDEPLSFDASDNSGIHFARLVDATPGALEKVVQTYEFTCDYSYAAPCPQVSGGALAPPALPAGNRLLKLQVIDAGGNMTETPLFTVNVGGQPNGSGADPKATLKVSFPRNRRSTLEVPFGKRASIRGQLLNAAGGPIAGATLQVLDRQLRAGTRYAVRAEVTTGADGTFLVQPGLGTARAIRFEYRSRKLLAAPDVASKVELRVQAGASLTISPKRVRPRGTIRISGRLRGLPLPASGKVVELQAFEGGKWRDFRTTRASKTGRFSTTYRFLRARRGASFLIRARIRRDDSYPYYLGYSPRVRVRVR
jgi:hypothetical protein